MLLLTFSILLLLELGPLEKLRLSKLYLGCNVLMLTELKRALPMSSLMKKQTTLNFGRNDCT